MAHRNGNVPAAVKWTVALESFEDDAGVEEPRAVVVG